MLDQPIEESEFVCTVCRRTGEKCPAAIGVMRDLIQADRKARQVSPAFELTGATQLKGCRETCSAAFKLSQIGVELFCGVAPDADLNQLSEFSTRFIEADADNLGTLPCDPPLAFVTTTCNLLRLEPCELAEAS